MPVPAAALMVQPLIVVNRIIVRIQDCTVIAVEKIVYVVVLPPRRDGDRLEGSPTREGEEISQRDFAVSALWGEGVREWVLIAAVDAPDL